MQRALSAVHSLAAFDGWLRSAILAFKYEDEWARGTQLGDLLATVLAGMEPVDALVPVPLHPARLRRRGYNQAAVLAHRAGAVRSIPVKEALSRTRATAQQVGLAAEARRANVEGAFEVAPWHDVRGLRLILVDDVVTTGSTLGACAGALVLAGATDVSGATLAREV